MTAAWSVFIAMVVAAGIRIHAVVAGRPFSFPLLGLIGVIVVLALAALILRLVKEFAEVGWGCRFGRPAPIPVTSGPRGGYAPRPRPQQYQSRGRGYQPRPQPRAYRPPVSQTDGYPDGWPDGPS